MSDTSRPRIAVFTHDTFGMGHIQRSMRIIGALAERSPEAALLLVTGSPVLHRIKSRPANCDYVKIPTIVKTGASSSRPPHLPIPIAEMTMLRERIIRESVLAFDPDVFLVDNFPLGSSRELMSLLHALRSRHTTCLVGLRDIVDSPEVVRNDWRQMGIPEVLDRYYDGILVYGVREVLDAAEAYRLPPSVGGRIEYCGYVTAAAPPPRPIEELRAELGIDGPFLLATGGGGGDSYPLLAAFIEALGDVERDWAVVVTGPLMGAEDRERLRVLADGVERLVLVEHLHDIPSYLLAAEAVVTMCGYNMAGELLQCRPRALVVPRTWRYGEHAARAGAKPEMEQLLRAQALHELGVIDMVDPEKLEPKLLAERLTALLRKPRPDSLGTAELRLDGLSAAADYIMNRLER